MSPVRPEFVPGEVLIRFKPRATKTARSAAQAQVAVAQVRPIPGGAERWTLPEGLTTEDAIARLRGNPDVQYVEPNYIVHAALAPNDPRHAECWGLHNTGQSGGKAGADIHAETAWEHTTGNRNVVVAVIDTGVDYTHPDLAANIWTNPGEIEGNDLDDDDNGYVDDVHGYDFANNDSDPMDDHFHGTHCAGTIGAVGDNGLGVAGVNWRVSIMAVKFLDANGSGTTADGAAAIAYATRMGAKILSNSWGGFGLSQTLYDAIQAAGDANVLFVAAAGNNGLDVDALPWAPGGFDLPNIVSVAATDRHDELASFSNFGVVSVDLGAPGVDILSTVPGAGYRLLSGTSMATPHVAGAAALIRSVDPGLGALDLKRRLLEFAEPIDALQGITVSGGRLDVTTTAGVHDEVPPAPIEDLTAGEPGSNTMVLHWTAPGDDGSEGKATLYDVRFSTAPIDEGNYTQASRAAGAPRPSAAGAAEVMEVRGLQASTLYYFAVRAEDEWENHGPLGPSAGATTLPPPVLGTGPSSFAATLPSGRSDRRTLSISNTGAGTLDWSIPTPLLAPAAAATGFGAGGPDRFGYRFIDSDQPGGPEFRWEEISSTGTNLSKGSGLTDPIPLGFPFTYYGLTFDAVRISRRGYLSFNSGVETTLYMPLPDPDAPPSVIAPYWCTMTTESPSRFHYQSFPDHFTVQYTSVFNNYFPGPNTFQVTLYASGEIEYRYLSMQSPIGLALIGLQNEAGDDGLTIAMDKKLPHDGFAVRIVPMPQWLVAVPSAGHLLPGQSQDVTLTLDAGRLAGGRYTTRLAVESNDPLRPRVEHPVTLDVVAGPRLELQTVLESRRDYDTAGPRTDHQLAAPSVPRGAGVLEAIVDGNYHGRRGATVVAEGTEVGSITGVAGDCVPVAREFALPAPQLAALLSDGRMEVAVQGTANVAADCGVNRHRVRLTYEVSAPGGLDFGSVTMGDTSTLDLLARNDGGETLHVSSVVEGAGFGTLVSALTIEPRSEAILPVRFAPDAPGTFGGTLRIDSDDPVEPSLVLPLRGSGTPAPGAAIEPASLSVSLAPGSETTRPIAITNDGDAPLDFSVRVRRLPLDPAPGNCHTLAYIIESTGVDDESDGRISSLDLATGARHTIATGLASMNGLALRPDIGKLYVDSWGGFALLEVDIATGVVRKVVSIAYPAGIALSPDGSLAYIGAQWLEHVESVRLTSGKSSIIAHRMPGVSALALDPDPGLLFSVAPYYGDLNSIDLVTGQVKSFASGIARPEGIQATPDGRTLYFTESGSGQLLALDRGTGTIRTIATGLLDPDGVALDVSGRIAYVSENDRGSLTAVDLATGATRPVASGLLSPTDIALGPPRDECSAAFVTVEPVSGTVPPHGSLTLDARFRNDGLFAGAHHADIQVTTNDPARARATIAATLVAAGAPSVEFRPESIDFPVTFVGSATDKAVTIANTGTDVLHVTGVTAGGEFSVESPVFPGAVPAGGSLEVTVRFAPSGAGSRSGTLSVTSDDPGGAVRSVTLMGTALAPPRLILTPATLGATLPAGAVAQAIATIRNDGGSELRYRAFGALDGADVPAGSLHGPDRFGNTWIDSESPGGPVFDWIDVHATGTPVDLESLDLPVALDIPIGFPFPFYGRRFETANLWTEGGLSFTNRGQNFDFLPLPNAALPENLVATFMRGLLYFPEVSTLIYRNDRDPFVVQYNHVRAYNFEEWYDFETLLYADGRIVLQYHSMGEHSNKGIIGIQNEEKDDGLLLSVTGPFAHDGLAVEIRPPAHWLKVAPLEGTLAPGESVTIPVGIDAATLGAGVARARLAILTNDPASSLVFIPVIADVQPDRDHDGVVDAADNCPQSPNPAQADRDADLLGDACDNCPGTTNAAQDDLDHDGAGDACDVCPGLFDAAQLDRDEDGLGDACDVCPGTPDPDQADRGHDGSGDACQPVLLYDGIADDAAAIRVRASASDPNDDPLQGRIDLSPIVVASLHLEDAGMEAACGLGYLPDGIAGRGIGFVNASTGAPILFDLDGALGCEDGVPDYLIAPGRCDRPDGAFDTVLSLPPTSTALSICVRGFHATDGGLTLQIESWDDRFLTGSVVRQGDVARTIPFTSGLPRHSALDGLTPGVTYRLVLQVSDGSSLPVGAEGTFEYDGQPELVFNRPPHAAASALNGECDRPGEGLVQLDGDGSTDPDSGTLSSDIASYAWSERLAGGTERGLGTGATLVTALAPGSHEILLRVTDSAGEASEASVTAKVSDTVAPTLFATVSPARLWPPNGRLVPVHVNWSAGDVCDSAPRVTLLEVTSSSRSSAGDIVGADLGTPDADFQVRARRDGNRTDRVYTLRYLATDASGNTTEVMATVTVPAKQ
ncbi:MAG TPA: S8 family serine peptidase [Candidatus Polarisedimenticolia bacterium]|nr:S8 family serine peptidase [Candidatus Polarisedimenticolia bacterium]